MTQQEKDNALVQIKILEQLGTFRVINIENTPLTINETVALANAVNLLATFIRGLKIEEDIKK